VTPRRTLVVCPGRGSYDRGSLGSLQSRTPAARAVVEACDADRRAAGQPTVTELDASPWRTASHVAGEHASLLTFACSLADLAELDRDRYEVVGVCGNSMGWYTALAAAGALDLADAVRLVATMGDYQRGNVIGGQVLYPVSDEDWVPSPSLLGGVEATLAAICAGGAWAGWSIRLGGFAVLAGDDVGVKQLLARLPPVQRGDRTFPLQLPLHSAFHTPLLQATRERAREELADLPFRAPDVDLVDGRGFVFRPLSADPAALWDWTLGAQVTEPYDFTTSVIAALHRTGADTVVALGPGNPLGGPLARILVQARWHDARTKGDFERLNAAEPLLRSFGMPAQRRELVRDSVSAQG
jgi:[acyl-carrier-protein] S-malonyltransferase